MFPWPVRVLGIVLAAVHIVLLSMTAFGFEYSVPFEDFITWLGDRIASALQLDAIEAMIRDLLAGFAIVLPELGKHWHHVFVLMWLLMGSMARMWIDFDAVEAPLFSRAWFRKAAYALAVLALAAVCALGTAVACGTVPLNSTGVAGWPLVGFWLYLAVLHYSAAYMYLPRWFWVVTSLSVAAAIAMGAIAMPMPSLFGIDSPSPALLFVVGSVGWTGVGWGFLGLFWGSTWRERLSNPRTAFGVDVLGAYGIAFALAAIFGKYTLG